MINQRKYALELLTNANFLACKLALIPIGNHANLLQEVFISQMFKPPKD